MADNKIYKDNNQILTIQAETKSILNTKVEFFSFDSDTARFIFKLEKDRQPLPISNAAKIFVVLKFIVNGIEKKRILDSTVDEELTVENSTEGTISLVIPSEYRGYVGMVTGGVYVQFDNGQSLDCGYFRFTMKKSMIDETLEDMSDFYVSTFESLQEKILTQSAETQEILDTITTEVAALEENYAPQLNSLSQQLVETDAQLSGLESDVESILSEGYGTISTLQDAFEGSANLTKNYLNYMDGFLIKNTGNADLSFTINGITIPVPKGMGFESKFGKFATVSIYATSSYSAQVKGKGEPITADTIPPNNVANLAASNIQETSLTLAWSASSSSDVVGYEIHKDGLFFTYTSTLSAVITGLTRKTSYSFVVKAKDASGNLSSGTAITATTAMPAPITDTFTKSTFGMTDTGQTYYYDGSGLAGATWSTEGGYAHVPNASGVNDAHAVVDAGAINASIKSALTIGAGGTESPGYILKKVPNSTNRIFIRGDGLNAMKVMLHSNGTFSTLTSFAFPMTLGATYNMEFAMVDKVLTMKVAGNLIGSYTFSDANYAPISTGTQFGIMVKDAASKHDNLVIQPL